MIGIFVVADLILASISRMSFAGSTGEQVVSTSVVVAALFAVAPITRYRLGSDASPVARFIVGRADSVGLLAQAVALIVALGFVG